jgi:hypothetical protein
MWQDIDNYLIMPPLVAQETKLGQLTDHVQNFVRECGRQ